jgi:hypothetical protein
VDKLSSSGKTLDFPEQLVVLRLVLGLAGEDRGRDKRCVGWKRDFDDDIESK